VIIPKEYKGKFYHWDSSYRKYIRDHEGKMISTDQCLCFAYEPGECCCAYDWSGYEYDDYCDD
jgi:hypothetical protein